MRYRTIFAVIVVVFTLCATNTAKVPKPADPWLCWLFRNCIPADPGWVPTFEDSPFVLSPFHVPTSANPWYFATSETATETCKRLNCTGIYVIIPCDLGGAPNTCSKPERILKFPTGDKNAGYLAAYWERNPENWFPDVALKLAKADLLK